MFVSRSGCGPVAIAQMIYQIDVRHVLPTIRVPTLIGNRTTS